jgi:cation-transporting ATPase E
MIGLFPIDLRNGSALTLFTVGIPTAMLAIWAQPGKRVHQSLGRTLARFVVPAAALSSLAGLAVLYGTLFLQVGFTNMVAGDFTDAALASAVKMSQTNVTSFLVFAGLVLVVFVEPPVRLLAVIEPRTDDRRPALMAIFLGVVYLVMLAIPAGRAIFSLQAPDLAGLTIAAVAVAGWAALLAFTWRHRLVERFLGV